MRSLLLRKVVALGVLAVNAPASSSAAAFPRSDWRAVQDLADGRRVLVRLCGGRVIAGAVLGVSATALAIGAEGGRQFIPRREVLEVRTARRSALRKVGGFLVGTVLGMLGGASLGYSIDVAGHAPVELEGLGGAVLGFLVGAVVGGILGAVAASRGGGVLVYRPDPRLTELAPGCGP